MQLEKFEGADLKYDNIFFLILAQKYRNKALLAPNLWVFVFRETLQLDKFEVADLKYDNIIFKF